MLVLVLMYGKGIIFVLIHKNNTALQNHHFTRNILQLQLSVKTYARFMKLELSRESRVIAGTKQQRFSNSKSRVILRITRPKLHRHYRQDKLGINFEQEK